MYCEILNIHNFIQAIHLKEYPAESNPSKARILCNAMMFISQKHSALALSSYSGHGKWAS